MIVSKKFSLEGVTLDVLTFNTKGDVCVIKTRFPVMGASGIKSFIVEGEVYSLLIEFRATVDSVNWTNWDFLSLENLSKLKLLKNHPFQIEYRVSNLETRYNCLYKISLELNYTQPEIPTSYGDLPFSKFMEFSNRDSLLWAVNVLEKFYKKSIVPSYIERGENGDWEDIDYLDFWWTPIYLNALRVSYNKSFKEVLVRKELLLDFINQRNLITSSREDISELYYLASFYYNEIRRRGTSKIFEESQKLPENFLNISFDGELLRLLNCKEDEIEKFILDGDEVGWFVGKTCPTYTSPTSLNRIIKGYEFTKDLVDLTKYPLINSQFISSKTENLNEGSSGVGMSINPTGSVSGFGFYGQSIETLTPFLIPVNIHFSYEITFLLKGGVGRTLEVGVDCFNSYGKELGPLSLITNFSLESNIFFSKKLQTNYGGKFIFIRCIVWSIDYTTTKNSIPTIGSGNNLCFKSSSTKSIIPRITVSDEGEEVVIYDFKVRPCILNSSESISQENLLYLRANNNSEEFSDDSLADYINTNLIPYNMILSYENKESKL